MINKYKNFILITLSLLLLLTVFIEVFIKISGIYFSVERYIYWIIFILWITIIHRRFEPKLSLALALFLLVCGFLLRTLSLNTIAEVLLRISFLGWLAGIFQAFAGILNKDGKEN